MHRLSFGHLPRIHPCLALVILAGCLYTGRCNAILAQVPTPSEPLHPELALQIGHRSSVLCLAFSADGKTLASGSADCTTKVWDLRAETLIKTHDTPFPVDCLTVSPDSRILAFKVGGGRVAAVGTTTGEHPYGLEFPGSLNSVAFSPDGRMVAGATNSGCVRLVQPRTGADRDIALGGVKSAAMHAVAFSPDGQTLAIGGDEPVVRLWAVPKAAFMPIRMAHGRRVRSLAFSPDGKMLATGGGRTQVEVKLWNPQTGTPVRHLRGGRGEVYSVAFSPDGRLLAAGSLTGVGGYPYVERSTVGEVAVWDAQTGALRYTLAVPSGGIRAVTFSADGLLLVAGGDDTIIRAWEARTGALRHTLAGYGGYLHSLALSPDGQVLAGAYDDGKVRLWDPLAGELDRTIAAHPGPVRAIAVSPDGRLLASGGEDQAAKLWDRATGALRRTLGPHVAHIWSLAFSPDGQTLAAGSLREASLWDLRSGRTRLVLTAHPDYVRSLTFAPDGRTLATGSRNRRGSETTDEELCLWDLPSGRLREHLRSNLGMSWVFSLAFSPDGTTLGIGGDGRVIFWDVPDGGFRAPSLQAVRGEALAFSPDGQTLALAAEGASGVVEGATIRLWDVRAERFTRDLVGHVHQVTSLAFLRDGWRLASGDGEGWIKLWNVRDGRCLATLLVAPPDSAPARPVGDNRPIPADSRSLTPDALAAENYLVVTPEGYYSGPAGADRVVRFRIGDSFFPAECFQGRYFRPLLVRRSLEGQVVPSAGTFNGPYPPLARFLAPSDGAAMEGDSVTVTLQATDDSRIERVELTVNGRQTDARPIPADSRPILADSRPMAPGGMRLPAAHRVECEAAVTIPLPPGERMVQLQAIAYDDDGLQSPRAQIALTRRPRPVAKGRLLGLCVGVSRYVDPRLRLKYADADAAAVANALNRQRRLYETPHVQVLTNHQATRQSIEAALDALVPGVAPADTVVLFLAGHGWRSAEDRFYFAPHDVDWQDIAGTGVAWDQVVRRLRALSERSRQVLVLLDACHSGSASATNDDLVQEVLRANAGVKVFASSRGSEWSRELDAFRHGAFTQALLEGLSGKASADGHTVTLADLVVYVARRVRALTQDQQHPYVPLLQAFDPSTPIALR